jgi:hypothetical protein
MKIVRISPLNFKLKGQRKIIFLVLDERAKVLATKTEEGLKCSFRNGQKKNKEPIKEFLLLPYSLANLLFCLNKTPMFQSF